MDSLNTYIMPLNNVFDLIQWQEGEQFQQLLNLQKESINRYLQ